MDPSPAASPVSPDPFRVPIRFLRRRPPAAAALIAGAALAFALFPAPAEARIWTVLADGSGSAPSVKAAADSAASGDTVQVGPGIFNDEHVKLIDKTLLIRGAGRDLTELNGFPHGHVFHLQGYDNYTEIRDLTIRNGVADNMSDIYGGIYGGGVYGEGALFALVNCRITECNCLSLGAGVYFSALLTPRDWAAAPPAPPTRRGRGAIRETVEIRDCLIDRCTAGAEGGGFCAERSYFLIENCEFAENHTVDGGGGSIINSFGVLTGCLFRDNLAEFDGGGLLMTQGLGSDLPAILVAGNTFVSNEAGRAGAGVMSRRAIQVSYERNIFANQTGAGGQAIVCKPPDGEYHGACNLFWANASSEFPDCQLDSTDVTGDPLFCNPSAGDYRLCASSPALAGPCGARGAFGVGCAGPGCGVATIRATWGSIKSLFR